MNLSGAGHAHAPETALQPTNHPVMNRHGVWRIVFSEQLGRLVEGPLGSRAPGTGCDAGIGDPEMKRGRSEWSPGGAPRLATGHRSTGVPDSAVEMSESLGEVGRRIEAERSLLHTRDRTPCPEAN